MSQIDDLMAGFEIPDEVPVAWASGAERHARMQLRAATRTEQRAAGAGASRPRWRLRRLMLPAALASGLAVAVVAVLALLPSGGSGTPTLLSGPSTAEAVLERAARIVNSRESSIPGPHQFLYLKFIEGYVGVSSAHGHDWADADQDTEQDWVAPDGSGRQRTVTYGFHFLTAADRASWKASRSRWPISGQRVLDGTYAVGAYFAGCAIRLTGLSTDPAVLLKQIVHRASNGHYSLSGTFGMSMCILQVSGEAPLRAAAYKLLAHLHGVEYLGPRTDKLGRRGVAVAIPLAREGVKELAIINPVTADPLALEQIQTRQPPTPKGAPQEQLPNGTVVTFTLYLSHGVVNSETALPGGGKVPMKIYKHPPMKAASVPVNPAQKPVTTVAELRSELSILRRPQTAADRLPAWAFADQRMQHCYDCLASMLPAESRLIATFAVPKQTIGPGATIIGPERVYMLIGKAGTAINVRGFSPAAPGVHLMIAGFVRYNRHLGQPEDELEDTARISSSQILSPRDVIVGQYETVGVVPDGVTKVEWNLSDPGQWNTVTVYPTIHDNVATAPVVMSHAKTGLGTEQFLVSATWYGPGGKVIASVNELPGLAKYEGGF